MAKQKAEGETVTKRPVGRPTKDFDLKIFEGLCKISCTKEEIAATMDMSLETLENKVREFYQDNFSGVYKRFQGTGKQSLRRMQFRAAQKGNVTMLIWLGKQVLGQTDMQRVEHSGEVTTIADTAKRRERIAELRKKLDDAD